MASVKAMKYSMFGIAQACALVSLFILMNLLSHCGGISWKRPWNVHGLLVFLIVYLQGLAISSFRILTFLSKKTVMLIHGSINFCVLVLAALALSAILDKVGQYSLHGIIGLITFSILGLQYWIGGINFLYPKLKISRIISLHRSAGAIVFSLNILIMMMFLNKYLFHSPTNCISKELHESPIMKLGDLRWQCIQIGFFTLLYGFLIDIGRTNLLCN